MRGSAGDGIRGWGKHPVSVYKGDGGDSQRGSKTTAALPGKYDL